MHLCISGFLLDAREDDSMKFEFDIPAHQASECMAVMKWKGYAEGAEGEFALNHIQIQQIEQLLGTRLPSNLALYISVEA